MRIWNAPWSSLMEKWNCFVSSQSIFGTWVKDKHWQSACQPIGMVIIHDWKQFIIQRLTMEACYSVYLSPFLDKRPDVNLVRKCALGLRVQMPVWVRNLQFTIRLGNQKKKKKHQELKRRSSTYSLGINFRIWGIQAEALSLLGVDDSVNDDMRDMNTLGPEFTCQRLGHSTGSELAHGECGKPGTTFECGCGT